MVISRPAFLKMYLKYYVSKLWGLVIILYNTVLVSWQPLATCS